MNQEQIGIGAIAGGDYRNEGLNSDFGYRQKGAEQRLVLSSKQPYIPMTEYVNSNLSKSVANISEQVFALEELLQPITKKMLTGAQMGIRPIDKDLEESPSSDLRNSITGLERQLFLISQRIAQLISRVDL